MSLWTSTSVSFKNLNILCRVVTFMSSGTSSTTVSVSSSMAHCQPLWILSYQSSWSMFWTLISLLSMAFTRRHSLIREYSHHGQGLGVTGGKSLIA